MARALAHSEKSRRAAAERSQAGAEARLGLLEFLLGSLDLEVCAQEALRWLSRELAIERAMCLVFDDQKKRLIFLAEYGVETATDFSVNVAEEEGHPLLVALSHREPTFFPATSRQPATPFGKKPFHAIALRSAQIRGPAAGVLLVEWATPDLPGDVAWFGEVFGEQVARLQSRLFPGEGHGRERLFLHSVLDAVSDPILLTDGSGNLILANARAEKLFTAPDESSEGRRRAVTLNNMLFSSALAGVSFDEGSDHRRELTLVDPSEGTDLLFELLTSPAKDLSGGSGIVSVLRNITDLGRAAEEIKESYRELRSAKDDLITERHRLDMIIDSVADPIVVTNGSGEVLLMNSPAERLFAVPKGKGNTAQRLVRSNDVNFSSFVSNLFFTQSARRHRGEVVLLDPATGDALPFEAVAGKVITEQGELTAIVTTLHDRREAIERARLYAQVEQAKNELEGKVQSATADIAKQNELLRQQAIELEQASNLKTQFLANMSHELRTPLNAILGYTHMLLNKVYGEPTPPQNKSLQRVDSNARHLLSIINEILDIARIESGKMPIHLDEVKLELLVREVLQELEPIVSRTKLKVTSHIGRMPTLHTDRQKVKQIIVNLLSNALKFTHSGTVSIRASFDARTGMINVAVRDSGIGIAPTDFQKIFEDFRQVDNSPTRQYGGTGLGLAICRRFAEMLGGKISLESKLGTGSTFTLRLPQRAPRR
jgi:signal transduction histidine kinase